MTTQDLINTLKQGKPMTDKLMREIVRELEEKNEQLHTMATALRAKDADYAALREAGNDADAELKMLRDEVFALEEAVSPVAVSWKKKRDMLVRHGEMEPDGECDDVCICVSSMQLDALAALVGEEKIA